MTDPQKLAEEYANNIHGKDHLPGTKAYRSHEHSVTDYIAGYKKGGEEVERLEERNTALHLKCIKDRTEAYTQLNHIMKLFEQDFKSTAFALHFREYDFNKANQLAESDWQSYCKANGLTPPKNTDNG